MNFKDYLSPEMVLTLPYNNKVDIWCLGVLCYELCAGVPPFETNSYEQTYKKISNIELNYPNYFSKEL